MRSFGIWAMGAISALVLTSLAQAADTSDASFCPVHGVKMQRVKLKILYGMPVPREFEEMRVAERLFPYGKESILAGCVVRGEKTRPGFLCPLCVQARNAWLKQQSGAAPASTHSAPDYADGLSSRAQAALEEFFALVNAGEIEEALRCMAASLTQGRDEVAAWRKQLSAIRSIHVSDVEPVEVNQWSRSRQKFKVLLEAKVQNPPDAPIPHYGWTDNPNIRWIGMELGHDGRWRIASIGTGP